MLAEIAKGLLLMHGHLTDPKLLKAAAAPQPASRNAAAPQATAGAAARSITAALRPTSAPDRVAVCC